jgi:hypothetical protein
MCQAFRNQSNGVRGSINQTEVSSAMAFLTGKALNQACSLLVAQSRELFGCCSSSQGVKSISGKNSLHDESAVSDFDSRNQLTDAPANKQQSSTRDYIKTLTSLYQKCKRAHIDQGKYGRLVCVPEKRKQKYFNNLGEVLAHAGIKPLSNQTAADKWL